MDVANALFGVASAIAKQRDAGKGNNQPLSYVSHPRYERSMTALHSTPVIILVRPQMGENIGMAARAMANFGLSELRLVAPRDGWDEDGVVYRAAFDTSVGANAIIRHAVLFPTVEAAMADLHKVFATTARERDQAKPVVSAEGFAQEAKTRVKEGQRIGILFGPERTGLENKELALADCLVSFPVDPAYSSLNLAQSVSLTAYEWLKAHSGGDAPFKLTHITPPATREMLLSFFEGLEANLDQVGYFTPAAKKPVMIRNLRNIFHRMELTQADVRTLRGITVYLSRGRQKRIKSEN
jgi:tRNA/rRNA methyltransferase